MFDKLRYRSDQWALVWPLRPLRRPLSKAYLESPLPGDGSRAQQRASVDDEPTGPARSALVCARAKSWPGAKLARLQQWRRLMRAGEFASEVSCSKLLNGSGTSVRTRPQVRVLVPFRFSTGGGGGVALAKSLPGLRRPCLPMLPMAKVRQRSGSSHARPPARPSARSACLVAFSRGAQPSALSSGRAGRAHRLKSAMKRAGGGRAFELRLRPRVPAPVANGNKRAPGGRGGGRNLYD